jgi:hypothetical protein
MPFAIIFGVLSAAFALIAELLVFSFSVFTESASSTPLPIGGGSLSVAIILTIVVGALIEEASKYLFLIRYHVLRLADRELALGSLLLLGLLFGLGFALPEAWFAWSAVGLEAAPIAGVILIHTLTSILLAAILLSPSKRFSPLFAFLLAVSLHIAYNIAAFALFPAY